MRDWQGHVRTHLSLPDLTPEREARIVRKLATQLEDFCSDALARGLSDADADAYACAQITDWDRPTYGRFSVAPANFLDWRQQNTSFERMATYAGTNGTLVWSDGSSATPYGSAGLAATPQWSVAPSR
jgi:hypothetical protein